MGRLCQALYEALWRVVGCLDMNRDGVLLLGGGGFIGSALARRLHRDQIPVQIVGRSNLDQLSAFLARCGAVVHLASSTTPGNSATQPELEMANLRLTQQLVKALENQPDTHLIFFSSGGTVYGNPTSLPVREDAALAPLSPHGAAKVAQENICLTLRARGHVVSILRPSNVYGPGQVLKGGFGLVRTLLQHAHLRTELQLWGDGENVRDYLYIDDLVDATLRMIECSDFAGTYNIGSGVGHSVNQVKALVEEVTGRSISVCYAPSRGVDVRAVVLDGQSLQQAIQWRPRTGLMEGIRHTWDDLGWQA